MQVEKANEFYSWWQNRVHGNYITNEQFDRIINNGSTKKLEL